MKLPNLIIFGAIKSGTGALHQYLGHHPDIFMSPLKEPRYFMHTDIMPGEHPQKANDVTIRSLQDYASVFEQASHERVVGESSSGYLYSKFAARKIREAVPDVRLVASLRNPVDRACAHFQMLKKADKIDSAVLEGKSAPWAQSSFYFENLHSYFELFPRKQIKVIIYEEWISNTKQTLKDLYEFLDVDDTFELNSAVVYRPATVLWPKVRRGSRLRKIKPYIPTRVLAMVNNYKARNVRPVDELIPTAVRSAMYDWYSQDIMKLEQLLDRDLSMWRNPC